jgi:hypothetical protein
VLSTLPIIGRLFSVPDAPRRWYQIIIWWELRRVAYNAIVGIVGILSVFAFFALASLRPKHFEDGPEPFAILIFGFGANLCFTGGWMGELVARMFWRERAAFFGPMMFSLGLLFSVALCFLPPLFAALLWLTTRP